MIRDQLSNWRNYHFSPSLEKAFMFLEHVNKSTPDGTYELEGRNVYAMVQSTDAPDLKAEKLEVHRRYIDIQYLICGSELLLQTPDDGTLQVHTAYNPDTDAMFYHLPTDRNPAELEMKPGDFAIFFPQDAHYGKLQTKQGGRCPIRKVVIKITVELY